MGLLWGTSTECLSSRSLPRDIFLNSLYQLGGGGRTGLRQVALQESCLRITFPSLFYLISSETLRVIWLDHRFLSSDRLVLLHFSIRPSPFMQTPQNWNSLASFFWVVVCYCPSQLLPVSLQAACEKYILVVCTREHFIFPEAVSFYLIVRIVYLTVFFPLAYWSVQIQEWAPKGERGKNLSLGRLWYSSL